MGRYAELTALIDDWSTPRVASRSTFHLDYATWYAHLSGSTSRPTSVDPLGSPVDQFELVNPLAPQAYEDERAA